MKSRSIAVNDIEAPERFTVRTRQELQELLQCIYHCDKAVEIYFDGIESIYYICPLNKFNAEVRKMVLKRAANLIRKNIPAKFNLLLKDNPKIPKDIFREVAV